MTGKEKRKYVRHQVSIPVDISFQGRFYHGWVKNISQTGAFIKVGGSFSVGQDISFYFLREIKIAKIVWVGQQEIAVKFR